MRGGCVRLCPNIDVSCEHDGKWENAGGFHVCLQVRTPDVNQATPADFLEQGSKYGGYGLGVIVVGRPDMSEWQNVWEQFALELWLLF